MEWKENEGEWDIGTYESGVVEFEVVLLSIRSHQQVVADQEEGYTDGHVPPTGDPRRPMSTAFVRLPPLRHVAHLQGIEHRDE